MNDNTFRWSSSFLKVTQRAMQLLLSTSPVLVRVKTTEPESLDSSRPAQFWRSPAFLPAHCSECYRIPLSPEHLCPLKGALPILEPNSHGLLDFRGKHTMCREAPGQNEWEKVESHVWDTATIAYQCSSTLSYKWYSVPGGGQTTKWHIMSSRQAPCSRTETKGAFPSEHMKDWYI